MSFRFIWIEADTQEDLDRLDRMLDQHFTEDETRPIRKAMTAAERARKYRESKKNRDETVTNCHEFVTVRDENVTVSQEKEEKEKKSTKRKEKEEKELNITLANAKVQSAETVTKNVTPDDSEYWSFAKANADLAEAFFRETGLVPIKSQFGRWQNDLRDLAEAEITIDRMRKTVAYMRSKDLPITAPGSILKTAQWLKARGSVPGQNRSSPDRWDMAAEKIEAELTAGDVFGLLENKPEVIDL